jgi:hypothetical protein
MAAAQIDDAAAAKESPHAARNFPRLVKFLPRQTAGPAHGSGEAVKQRLAGKAIEIAFGKASTRRRRERHAVQRSVFCRKAITFGQI